MTPLPRRDSRRPRMLALATLAGVVTVLASPLTANATEQPVRLSAAPVDQSGPFFDLTLEAGQTRELGIALGNHGAAPIAARTYAADAYTIINGGFGAGLRGGGATGTTTWLDYPGQVLTLQPDQISVRTFSVKVPKGTPAGEYITSVILENDAPIKDKGGVALDQILRQAVAVAIRVPGPLRSGLAIGDAHHKVAADRSVVAVDVTNTGNMHLTPKSKIVVHDDAGAVVSRATVPMDSFYARTTTKVEITLARTLQPGDYFVDLTLDDGKPGAHAAARNLPFTVGAVAPAETGTTAVRRQVVDVLQAGPETFPPWAAALGVLGAILLLGGAVRVCRRRSLRGRHPAPSQSRLYTPAISATTDDLGPDADGPGPRPNGQSGNDKAPEYGGGRRIGV